MAPPTMPATRRVRKSIGIDTVARKSMDKENATVDLGSTGAAKKSSRSKSMGPGGLDALKQASGNRRAVCCFTDGKVYHDANSASRSPFPPNHARSSNQQSRPSPKSHRSRRKARLVRMRELRRVRVTRVDRRLPCALRRNNKQQRASVKNESDGTRDASLWPTAEYLLRPRRRCILLRLRISKIRQPRRTTLDGPHKRPTTPSEQKTTQPRPIAVAAQDFPSPISTNVMMTRPPQSIVPIQSQPISWRR